MYTESEGRIQKAGRKTGYIQKEITLHDFFRQSAKSVYNLPGSFRVQKNRNTLNRTYMKRTFSGATSDLSNLPVKITKTQLRSKYYPAKKSLLILIISFFSGTLTYSQKTTFTPLHIESFEAIFLSVSSKNSKDTEPHVHFRCSLVGVHSITVMPILYNKYSTLETPDYICTPSRYKRFDPEYIEPAPGAETIYERQMHYRSAEMVMQSWQNATGWQNTTITIKNTRL